MSIVAVSLEAVHTHTRLLNKRLKQRRK